MLLIGWTVLISSASYAQCSGPNLLLNNPGFELPVVPNIGGANNIVASVPGWTNRSTVNTTINILRPMGTGIAGRDNGADGNQYIDLQERLV